MNSQVPKTFHLWLGVYDKSFLLTKPSAVNAAPTGIKLVKKRLSTMRIFNACNSSAKLTRCVLTHVHYTYNKHHM